jgi:VIT1/CCC1 family predicted Fe2+/Mn2+ transporter
MLTNFRSNLAYYIGDIVYGANDGIITTFAVVAAAAGAGVSSTIIIILGIANLVADGFSMGASAYLSMSSEQEVASDTSEAHDRSPLVDGIVTFISFVVAGSLPLVPFFVPSAAENAFFVSSIATGTTFFVVGAARSLVIKKNAVIAGLEMLLVGGVASLIAYGLGSFVETLVR